MSTCELCTGSGGWKIDGVWVPCPECGEEKEEKKDE